MEMKTKQEVIKNETEFENTKRAIANIIYNGKLEIECKMKSNEQVSVIFSGYDKKGEKVIYKYFEVEMQIFEKILKYGFENGAVEKIFGLFEENKKQDAQKLLEKNATLRTEYKINKGEIGKIDAKIFDTYGNIKKINSEEIYSAVPKKTTQNYS